MKCDSRRHRSQQGMALLFALLALLVLTFGAVALIRTVDGGVLALGNLAFKQTGLVANARGADAGEAWLSANIGSALLNSDQAALGYYASSRPTLDPTGSSIGSGNLMPQVDWDGNNCVVNGQSAAAAGCLMASSPVLDVNGDKVRYIITRLCTLPAAVGSAGNSCELPPIAGALSADDKSGAMGVKKPDRYVTPPANPYFRIITRALGPNGTVSFTETLVHF